MSESTLARNVVLATDFSPCSETAAEVAAELARVLGAQLHVLHVTGPRAIALSKDLEDIAERLSSVPKLSLAVEVGAPAAEIVRYAARHDVDLIVMGTHGRTGLTHVVRGSVAEEVLRTAKCNVLTVKSDGHERPVGAPGTRPCLICAAPGAGLICERCVTKVTAEARERKLRELRQHA
jgi:universal stress protein A